MPIPSETKTGPETSDGVLVMESARPNFCESCAGPLATCDCATPRPTVVVYASTTRSSPSIDLVVKRLLDPQFGSDSTERLLMGAAADAIRHLQGDLVEAQAKMAHLAKQEADIRAAYELRRASEAEFVRENKRLDREWAASIEQAKYWQGVAERALAKQAALTVALKPFADLGVGEGPDDEPDAAPYRILRGAIRRARAALEGAL